MKRRAWRRPLPGGGFRWGPWLALASFGCIEIAPPESNEVERSPLVCDERGECSEGQCDAALGRCVSTEHDYPGLVFEVVPPATDERFGGLHFFQGVPEIIADSAQPGLVAVAAPQSVRGVVRIAFPADLGCDQVPVKITLTPVQALLGIQTQRFVTISERAFSDTSIATVNGFAFSRVPAGVYDIYVEDTGRVLDNPQGCDVVPQVFRQRVINPGDTVELTQPLPRTLRVEIPWRDDLAGWSVDVVHPSTWETVSTQRVLSSELVTTTAAGERFAGVDLKLSTIADDYVFANDELLRIRPPVGSGRPTIYLVLSGLVVISEGVAQVGNLETFALTRRFEAWVWVSGKPETAVSGRVEFIADRLANAPEGLPFVRLRHVIEIDDDGKVRAELPPGTYTVRVYPTDTGLSLFETQITVWAPPASNPQSLQTGRVLEVSTGAQVSGSVRLAAGAPAADTLIEVQRQASFRGGPLANPFAPRGASAIANAAGQFAFGSVDCRRCDRESGAQYTLRVIPHEALELPWLVTTPVIVAGEMAIGELRVPPPLVHFGQLSLIDSRGMLRAFPGALLRAYALLDSAGTPQPVSTPSCVAASSINPAAPCVRRAVLIGETRTGTTGAFRLLLPPTIQVPSR